MPHASIGSDVIVGFPGETADDFAQLESYLAGSPLTHLHVFPYSDRPGTAAAMLPARVHGTTVRERAGRVREIGRDLTRKFHRSQDGAVRPGLTIEDGSLVVTDNYLKVRIPPGLQRNEWVAVTVTLDGEHLVGQRDVTDHINAAALCAGDLVVAFDNQLTASRPNVAASAFPYRYCNAGIRKNRRKSRRRARRTAAGTESRPPHSAESDSPCTACCRAGGPVSARPLAYR